MLDNLLFWLKGQICGKNLDRSIIIVYQLVKGLEDEHKMLFRRKNILFSNNLHPQMFINADKEMIRIVLRSLISNAIKFTLENGTIQTHATQTSTHAIICVEDSGIGMTQETIEKISAKHTTQRQELQWKRVVNSSFNYPCKVYKLFFVFISSSKNLVYSTT